MKNFLKKNYLLIVLIIIQTIIYIFIGCNKEYIHMDEAYSYGLANYKSVEIEENEDFFDNWHENKYYEDYLSVQKEELWDFSPVYKNQKNDVHPPLFYLLLRIGMNITNGRFSKWAGIILNIVIYAFVTVFMYLILKKILNNEKYAIQKSTLLAFVSSVTLAAVSNVINIRMYSLLTLDVLIITFLHIKLLEQKNTNLKLLICIGIGTLLGSLTHYYYFLYLVPLYLIFFVKYIKEKRIKELVYYTLTMVSAGIMFIVIFPYSIEHIFFGYRGQGVISNLENAYDIIGIMYPSICNLNHYGFNDFMYTILIIILILFISKILKKRKLEISKEKRTILRIIWIPSIFFFVVSAIASPWKVLRYIVPVCGLIFVLLIYLLYKLVQTVFSEKISNVLISLIICIILIFPCLLKLEPELLYSDRKEIVQKLGGELNLPTIYFFNSKKGKFLDDILLFSIIDESYIAKDIEYTESNIEKIIEAKDISKGIIVFINEEDIEEILKVVKKVTGLNNIEHLNRLNSCDVYFVRNLTK